MVLGSEGEADDRPWRRVLTLDLLEPFEVQRFPDLDWDIFQRNSRLSLVKEVTLWVKHDHGVFGEHLRVVRDLQKV